MLEICHKELETVEELMAKIADGTLERATLVFENGFAYVSLQGNSDYRLSEDVTSDEVVAALVRHAGLKPHIT